MIPVSAILTQKCLRRGNTPTISAEIYLEFKTLAAFLLVNNKDLINMYLLKYTQPEMIVEAQQEGVRSCNEALRVTGVSLKKEKCFWYPIS